MFTGGFNHYSNGQYQCSFEGFERRADDGTPDLGGNCVQTTTISRPTINALDGDFSTNYINVEVHYARLNLETAPGKDEGDVRGNSFGVSLQLKEFTAEIVNQLPGGIDDALRARYGEREALVRAWYQPPGTPPLPVPYCWLNGCGLLTPDGPLVFETQGYLRGGGSMMDQLHRGLTISGKWLLLNEEAGLLVQAYFGTNYYNINFEEPLSGELDRFLLIGLTWDPRQKYAPWDRDAL